MGVYKKLDRLSVAEAANRLGVKEQAVRKRIQRGTIQHEKDEDGRVYVYLDTPDNGAKSEVNGNSTDRITNIHTLTEALQDQIEYLRDQLDAERAANRENRRIIAAALERVPRALETAPEPRDEPETPMEPADVGPPQQGAAGAQQGTQRARRPWWVRIFVGG